MASNLLWPSALFPAFKALLCNRLMRDGIDYFFMSWRLLNELGSDIYSNLAMDEAIAKTNLGVSNMLNTIRFWQSQPAVVIGRFQCVHREVDLAYCEDNGICIARRFTGGGAVFHDVGNLNFAIRLHQSHLYVPRGLKELYQVFIGRVTQSLVSINIPAEFDPVGSCIRINGKKISGTAGWIKQGVSFIHGTLLINADLVMLQRSLTAPAEQQVYLRDKTRIRCMDSKHDTVTNLNLEVEDCPTTDEIKSAIIESLEEMAGAVIEEGHITQIESDTAQALYHSHYTQPSWNLGTPTPITP